MFTVNVLLALASSAVRLARADPTATFYTDQENRWYSSPSPIVQLDGATVYYQENGDLVVKDPHSGAILWQIGDSVDCYGGKCQLYTYPNDNGGSLVACQDRGGGCRVPDGYIYNSIDNYYWNANLDLDCGYETPADRLLFQSGDPYIALLAGDFIEWCTHGASDFYQASPSQGDCPPAGQNPRPPGSGGSDPNPPPPCCDNE